jgi:hypothetical protein
MPNAATWPSAGFSLARTSAFGYAGRRFNESSDQPAGTHRVRRLIQVMQESWNHLILLDACRYDAFARRRNRFFSAGRLECGASAIERKDLSIPNSYLQES